MILRPEGHAEPVEVGVLCHMVSEITTILFEGGKTWDNYDLNSTWNRFQQCHPEDVKIDQCTIQLWKGK
jgi:hypothetical protein